MNKLSKAGLTSSLRGQTGGYKLKKSADKITLAQVLRITGDLPELAPCLRDQVCPIKNKCNSIGVWEGLTKVIDDYLEKITIKDVLDKNY